MRLKNKRDRRHRANTADRTVQTPTMARRSLTADPSPTQLIPVIRPSHAEGFLTRELPKVTPADLPKAHPHTPFTPLSGHPVPPLDATQPLPRIPVQAALPPSARHVDPANWHGRTHAEDSDLEPQSRGRHVLTELESEPGMAVLVAAQRSAHATLDAYDPMRRAEVAARANDDRMRAFAAKSDAWGSRYEREFESWAQRFKNALAETRSAWAVTSGRTNAARLTMDYADGGTSAALYTKDELAAEIARRDTTGSAVSQ